MRSRRAIPGLLPAPAVRTTASEPSISLKSLVPFTLPSNSIAGAACIMSSASPLAKSSAMSIRTTSLILNLRMLNAEALPTFPAPMMEIMFLSGIDSFKIVCARNSCCVV